MADMPSGFWSGWIAAITVVSLIGLSWLVVSIFFSRDGEEAEASPVWDETLTEGNNPAPMWWFWLIFSALIVSVIYLILYPGLGSFSGVLKWSQGGRLSDSTAVYHEEYADGRRRIIESTLPELQQDAVAMATAQRIFDQHCSACHGPGGQGQAAMFPDLMDDDWQWGGDPISIEQTLRNGRNAVMVGWEPVLGSDGVEQVTQYVMSMSQGQQAGANADGQRLYAQFCIACHGATGTGMTALGGPDLTDEIWLYGGDESDIRQSIAAGRAGEMPAFGTRLDDVQRKLLLAWLTRTAVN